MSSATYFPSKITLAVLCLHSFDYLLFTRSQECRGTCVSSLCFIRFSAGARRGKMANFVGTVGEQRQSWSKRFRQHQVPRRVWGWPRGIHVGTKIWQVSKYTINSFAEILLAALVCLFVGCIVLPRKREHRLGLFGTQSVFKCICRWWGTYILLHFLLKDVVARLYPFVFAWAYHHSLTIDSPRSCVVDLANSIEQHWSWCYAICWIPRARVWWTRHDCRLGRPPGCRRFRLDICDLCDNRRVAASSRISSVAWFSFFKDLWAANAFAAKTSVWVLCFSVPSRNLR